MKKFIFGMALFCAMCMASCGNGAKTEKAETVKEVTEQVTAVATDSVEAVVAENDTVEVKVDSEDSEGI